MKNITVSLLFLAGVMFGSTAQARGLLGERYVFGGAGVIFVGDDDVKEIDDKIMTYVVGVNIPVHPNVDLDASVDYSELSGDIDDVDVDISETDFNVGFTAHLSRRKKWTRGLGPVSLTPIATSR